MGPKYENNVHKQKINLQNIKLNIFQILFQKMNFKFHSEKVVLKLMNKDVTGKRT